MPNSNSKLHRAARKLRRRPSVALVVASTALFLALSGGAYATVLVSSNSISNSMLMRNSVGTVKLRKNSVTYQKIAPGSVGTVRIDKQEVQARINGACTTGGQAITSVTDSGTVTCGAALPSEYSSSATANVKLTPSTAKPAMLAAYALPAGMQFLVQANPYITVSGNTDAANQTVIVACTLTAGTATTATETRHVSIFVPANQPTVSASIPMILAAPASAASVTSSVSCTGDATDATVSGQATIYALGTATSAS